MSVNEGVSVLTPVPRIAKCLKPNLQVLNEIYI